MWKEIKNPKAKIKRNLENPKYHGFLEIDLAGNSIKYKTLENKQTFCGNRNNLINTCMFDAKHVLIFI